LTRRALVTGATGALGAAFCRLLSGEEFAVIAIGRDEARLATLAEEFPAVTPVRLDIAEPAAVEQLVTAFPDVEILIAAAGAAIAMPVVARDRQGIEREIATNATSVATLCHAYGVGMAARGHGRIVTVASTAAARPAPCLAVYGGAKAFVLAFSRSLSQELKGRGVRVTCCISGPIRSPFSERAGLGVRPGGLDPLQVASLTLRANARGRSLVFASTGSRLRWLAFRAMPEWLFGLLLAPARVQSR
jgi:short-subunit dehydrogenase